MELVKELPEIFEEFAEQRQKSFLVMKEVKDKGIPVIGAYCTYFPQEIAMAMGAVTVGLCSTSDETIPVAEKDLPKNLCPMVKASYGFALNFQKFFHSNVKIGAYLLQHSNLHYFTPVFVSKISIRNGNIASCSLTYD